MPVACHSTQGWNWCLLEDEKKETKDSGILLLRVGSIRLGVLPDFGTKNYTCRLDIVQKSL